MASGPVVMAATPHRTNAAYQALIDRGPPTTFGSPTPTQPAKRKRDEQVQPVAWPALLPTGRPTQTPSGGPTGLQASTHARPDQTAAAALDDVLAEVQRRDAVTRKIFNLVARSLDNIAAACINEEKPVAREITRQFTAFLTTNLLPSKTGASPTPANEPNGWAAIARGGGPAETHTTQQKGAATTAVPEDIRILARLPQEQSEWAKTVTNFALRKALCDKANLSLVDVPNIYRTATGFAIHPRNKDIRQKILAKEKEVSHCLRATKLDLPTKWYNYVVPNCPTKLPNLFGEMLDVSSVIEDETLAQTGQRPIRIRPSRHTPDADTDKGSWIVSFLEEVPPFRLFDSSARARLIQKKPSITRHNPGCQGFHPGRFCARNARCENCGASVSSEDGHPQPCTSPAKCANCHGPAPAGHDNCPAKPTRKSGKLKIPTKKELTAIRRAGQKLYDAKHKTSDKEARPTRPQDSGSSNVPSSPLSDPEAAMDTDPTEGTPSEDAQGTSKETAETPTKTQAQRSRRLCRSTSTNNYNYTNRYAFLDNDLESSE